MCNIRRTNGDVPWQQNSTESRKQTRYGGTAREFPGKSMHLRRNARGNTSSCKRNSSYNNKSKFNNIYNHRLNRNGAISPNERYDRHFDISDNRRVDRRNFDDEENKCNLRYNEQT